MGNGVACTHRADHDGHDDLERPGLIDFANAVLGSPESVLRLCCSPCGLCVYVYVLKQLEARFFRVRSDIICSSGIMAIHFCCYLHHVH